jgi:PAS domain S-box-containing protein
MNDSSHDLGALTSDGLGLPDGIHRLAPLLDALPVAICVCDAAGRVVFSNARAAELWGGAPPHGQSPNAQALRDGASVRDREVVVERADGSQILALLNVAPLKGDQGRLAGAVGCFHEIAAPARAAAALVESERRNRLYETIVSSTPDLVYSFDLNYRFTFANQALLTMWGRTLENSIGKSLLEIGYEPWHAEMHEREIDQVVATKQAIRGEVAFPHATLGRRVYDYIFVPVLNAAGEVEAIAGTTRDVTERKQAEQALAESEMRLRALVTASSDAVYRMSPDWSVLRVLHGRDFMADTTDPSRTWLETYIHPDDQQHVMETINQAVRTKSVFELEHRVRRVDGSFGWTFSRAVPLLDAKGELAEWFGMASDVTERRQAEQHREMLMAELDHRVKNTLATVQSLAASTLRSDERQKALSGRLAALAHAHNLLAESKWEGAGLAGIVETALAPYRGERVALAGADVRLGPRAAQTLSMTLHELATNAAKYGALSSPRGRLDVSWEVAGPAEARRLVLNWVEAGGPSVTKPSRTGFGSKLIELGVAHELRGETELEYRPEGLRCKLTIPLPENSNPMPG